MNEMLLGYSQNAAYAGIYACFAFMLSQVLNRRAAGQFSAEDAIAGGNVAVGWRRSGAQVGLAIAFLGVLMGKSNPSFLTDILNSSLYGVVAIVFIGVSLFIVDKAILPNIDNNKAISEGNTAVGITEFGILVMMGTIAFASIYGDTGGFISSIGYFVLGQATVIVLVIVSEKLTIGVNLLKNIAEGQVASGAFLAGKMIAYGIILMSAIKGAGGNAGLVPSLIEFGVAAGIGMFFLWCAELFIDRFIVTKTSIKEMLNDNNVAAVLQLSGVRIGMALILGFAVL